MSRVCPVKHFGCKEFDFNTAGGRVSSISTACQGSREEREFICISISKLLFWCGTGIKMFERLSTKFVNALVPVMIMLTLIFPSET